MSYKFPATSNKNTPPPTEEDFHAVQAALRILGGVAMSNSTKGQRKQRPFPALAPEFPTVTASGMGIVYNYGQPANLVTVFGDFRLPEHHFPRNDAEQSGILKYSHGPEDMSTSLAAPAYISRGDQFGPYRQIDQIKTKKSDTITVPPCVLIEPVVRNPLAEERYQQWIRFGGDRRKD